jgi:REP element-mobilizing transposase RayT
MTRPPRLDAAGTVTHVIARGNERRPLFRDDADREKYLELLGEACGKHGARVFAYCLMPNHVHLALQTGEAPLSRVVHEVHSRYARTSTAATTARDTSSRGGSRASSSTGTRTSSSWSATSTATR